MRRLSFAILLTLLVLLLVAAVVIQIVLFTDLPRRMVTQQLQRDLGLRVSSDSLSAGWFGRTTLKNVTLTLPLADEAFLTVPRLEASHTALVPMLIGRPMRLQRIAFHSPTLIVRQDESGRWNLQEVAQLLARAAGAKEAEEKPEPAALPRLLVDQATIHLEDRAGRRATVQPLTVRGRPDGPLMYRYDAAAPPQLHLTGQLVPREDWKHQVTVTLEQLEPWVRPWVQQWPRPARLAAQWQGQRRGEELIGRLDVQQIQLEQASAQGVMGVRLADGALHLAPESWLVRDATPIAPELRLTSGEIVLDPSQVRADQLRLATAGGILRLDGHWRWTEGSARVSVAWDELALPLAKGSHSGELSATLQTPWPDQPRIDAELTTRGQAQAGAWDAAVHLVGNGTGWRQIDWELTVPRLSWIGDPRTLTLRDVSARLRTDGPTLRLDNLALAGAKHTTGLGAVDFDSLRWWLYVEGRQWPVPGERELRVDLNLSTWGTPDAIQLEQFYLHSGETDLFASGTIIPTDLSVYVTQLAVETTGEDELPLSGTFRSEAHLTGTLRPLELTLEGKFIGQDLAINQRPLGEVMVKLHGGLDQGRLHVETERLTLLEGQWEFRAVYPGPRRAVRLDVAVEDLSLQAIGELTGATQLAGRVNGELKLDLPSLQKRRIAMSGEMKARDVRAATGFAADSIEAQLALQDGLLTIKPMLLRRGDGRADAKLRLDVTSPRKLDIELTAADWPIDLPAGVMLLARGQTRLEMDLARRAFVGPVSLRLRAARGDEPVGEARLYAQLHGRTLDLSSAEFELLDGHARGQMLVNFDDWLQSYGSLEWEAIDGDALATIFPQLRRLSGTFAGWARLEPSQDPRAVGPLLLRLYCQPEQARFGAMELGEASAAVYLDISRVVLDSANLSLGGGQLNLWARAAKLDRELFSSQLHVDLRDLSLDQIVHAVQPDAEPMPGRLSGSFTLLGNPRDHQRLSGRGKIEIRESELGNSDIISTLYTAMAFRADFGKPTGAGSARLSLESSVLRVSDLRYFNRGVEIRADGIVRDVWDAPESPLDGVAVGSARPLKNLKLPFAADVDKIMGVLQANVTTVRIGGLLGKPEIKIVPFREITDAMRSLILGEVGGEGKK